MNWRLGLPSLDSDDGGEPQRHTLPRFGSREALHPRTTTGRVLLGSFELDTPIARGGMGEVWRGHHLDSGAPVAVKIVSGPMALDPNYHRDFRREVQAVASLSHPGVVMVFDYGVLPPAAESLTDGRLLAGSPYLVMEYASRGSLEKLRMPLTWLDYRRIVLAVLDALAHAHARGVVHRDIKPGNILLGSHDDPRPRLKLTDFGIAHPIEVQRPTHREANPSGLVEDVLGTPWYMAPEQLTGHWRDYGPWTDLYALGIVAWELATGAVPFDGSSMVEIGMAHLHDPLPTLSPRLPVPHELEGWLQRMASKRFDDRFACAADAAAALRAMPEPDPLALPIGTFLAGPTLPEEPPTLEYAPAERATVKETAVPGLATGARILRDDRFVESLPPMPATWRPNHDVDVPAPIVGAGLGVVNLRVPGFVGRERERDLLWDALHHARATGLPRAVVIRGVAGVGKSALARWLCDRAHEVGAATVLKASHTAAMHRSEGLPDLLNYHLRVRDLPAADLVKRVDRELQRLGITTAAVRRGVADLAAPAAGVADEDQRRFGRARDRWELALAVLRALGTRRPLVVWFDDVQWGADSIAFVHHVLDTFGASTDLPALFVLTARDDALAEDESLSARVMLDALSSIDACATVSLDPLAPTDCRALLDELLVLDNGLAERVVVRSGGNPLFATHIVSEWVTRGALHTTPGGFRLRDGVDESMPDDLYTTWRARADAIVASHGTDARRALEVAALLDGTIRESEWRDAAAQLGVAVPTGLVDALSRARLVEAVDGGWQFAHSMIREAIERAADEHGQLATIHRAIALMLVERYPPDGPGIAERKADHLVAAGELDAAVDALLVGAEQRFDGGEFVRAERLLVRREEALASARPDRRDPRWAEGRVWLADTALRRGDAKRAIKWADSAAELARVAGTGHLEMRALDTLCAAWRREGDLPRARSLGEAALALADRVGDDGDAGRVLLNLGHTALAAGDSLAAIGRFGEARDAFDRAGDVARRGRAWLAQAAALDAQALHDEARIARDRAASDGEVAGDHWLTRQARMTSGTP